MIKEVLSGYVKHGLKLRKFQVYPPKEFSLDDVDVVKMAMYSVSRISRLVDMYHGCIVGSWPGFKETTRKNIKQENVPLGTIFQSAVL